MSCVFISETALPALFSKKDNSPKVQAMKATIKWVLLGWITVLIGCKQENETSDLVFNPRTYDVLVPSYVVAYLGDLPQPPENKMTHEGVALGRQLFFDVRLSDDFSMSCATCHLQENGFSDPRPFSQGTNGAFGDRNAMSIVNLAWSNNLFWDGRRHTLESQAHDPVTNPVEMRNTWPTVVSRLQQDESMVNMFFKAFGTTTVDSTLVMKAIAQFERTLISFNSPYDRFFYYGDTLMLNASQKRGLDLFFGEAECVHCHSGPLLTDNSIRNNGLDEMPMDPGLAGVSNLEMDWGKFKVPTLRNIAQTSPYMHDGRFETLEQVIDHYDHGVYATSPNLDIEMGVYAEGLGLTAQEKTDLVNFLMSLTDQEFLTSIKFQLNE